MRSRNAASISFGSCALVLAATVLTGCGSHKSGIRGLSSCEARVENTAATEVVRKAFDAGKLGTAQSLAGTYFKGEPRSSYLDESGKLRPYGEFTNNDARFDLEAWMAHLEGLAGPLSDRMFAARMRARQQSTCKDKTA